MRNDLILGSARASRANFGGLAEILVINTWAIGEGANGYARGAPALSRVART
jgi:hypothetical protein